MQILRTPDERFVSLPDYDFEPHYVQVPTGDGAGDGNGKSLRVHYVDAGPTHAEEIVLLLHGEPSWSYLYRKMITNLADSEFRVIAPDLVGFGRSDKPADRNDYTYARHVEWMRAALFDALGLSDLTLVGQDWGGLIGLRLVAEHPDRFRRVVAANTGLPTGDDKQTEAFFAWQRFSQEVPEMHIGRIVSGGSNHKFSDEVVAAYDAPFPDESYKEGARQFPLLVPSRPNDPASEANRRAWQSLSEFERPFLCAFSDGDAITRGADRRFLDLVPGTKGQDHTTIKDAGHFLQEDQPEVLASAVRDFIHLNRSA
ncbi:MAG TPA: haloalkane dehalogenase [Acidimicrobiales bacterium]|nr:haloalkane dehalogenase [Acidimicrobiales bacterium]